MTKKELLKQLSDIPDNTIICGVADMSGDYYEITSIEYMTDEQYYDEEDEIKTRNILVI
jgi:hypothetical protein